MQKDQSYSNNKAICDLIDINKRLELTLLFSEKIRKKEINLPPFFEETLLEVIKASRTISAKYRRT